MVFSDAPPRKASQRSASHRAAAPRSASQRPAPPRTASLRTATQRIEGRNSMKTQFEIAFETRTMMDFIRPKKPGETFTYADVTQLMGYPVTSADSHLQSALRILERDEGIVCGNIRGIGYKVLDDTEIVHTGEAETQGVRRRIRRATRRISSVRDFAKLPKDERLQHNMFLSMFHFIRFATSRATQKRITAAVANSDSTLPVARTLKALTERQSRKAVAAE